MSEARSRLSGLARRVRERRERIILTRDGAPEAVLLSVDELEGLEMTVEILGDNDAVVRISESLTALDRGEPGADAARARGADETLCQRRVTTQSAQLQGPAGWCDKRQVLADWACARHGLRALPPIRRYP